MAGQGVVIGVDLGGTKVQAVALKGRSRVGEARTLTPQTSADEVVARVVETVLACGIPLEQVSAVGIGSPGEIDCESGNVRQARNLPGFEGTVPLGRLVSQALGGVRVEVDNDVRSAIWGEYRLGAGRPFRNLLGVFVGTGVGGALVVDGRLHEGRGAAGEIGHMVVKPGGRRCGCGRRGCLEAYAGRAQIEVQARKLVAKGRKTVLFELMKKRGRDRVTSGVIAAALELDDKLTRELVDKAVEALGVGVASAQNLLDAEAVIVGGGLGDRLGSAFVNRITEAMMPHLFADDRPPKLLTTELGDLAGATGAAVLASGLGGVRRGRGLGGGRLAGPRDGAAGSLHGSRG